MFTEPQSWLHSLPGTFSECSQNQNQPSVEKKMLSLEKKTNPWEGRTVDCSAYWLLYEASNDQILTFNFRKINSGSQKIRSVNEIVFLSWDGIKTLFFWPCTDTATWSMCWYGTSIIQQYRLVLLRCLHNVLSWSFGLWYRILTNVGSLPSLVSDWTLTISTKALFEYF